MDEARPFCRSFNEARISERIANALFGYAEDDGFSILVGSIPLRIRIIGEMLEPIGKPRLKIAEPLHHPAAEHQLEGEVELQRRVTWLQINGSASVLQRRYAVAFDALHHGQIEPRQRHFRMQLGEFL